MVKENESPQFHPAVEASGLGSLVRPRCRLLMLVHPAYARGLAPDEGRTHNRHADSGRFPGKGAPRRRPLPHRRADNLPTRKAIFMKLETFGRLFAIVGIAAFVEG